MPRVGDSYTALSSNRLCATVSVRSEPPLSPMWDGECRYRTVEAGSAVAVVRVLRGLSSLFLFDLQHRRAPQPPGS